MTHHKPGNGKPLPELPRHDGPLPGRREMKRRISEFCSTNDALVGLVDEIRRRLVSQQSMGMNLIADLERIEESYLERKTKIKG